MWGTADAVKSVMAEKIDGGMMPSSDGANNGVSRKPCVYTVIATL